MVVKMDEQKADRKLSQIQQEEAVIFLTDARYSTISILQGQTNNDIIPSGKLFPSVLKNIVHTQ